MARWAAFAGLTAVVCTLLLVLAQLSQRLVSDADDAPAGRPSGTGPAAGRWRDPVIPRFEPAAEFGSTGPVGELSSGALLANVALTQGTFGMILLVGTFYFQIPLSAFGIGDAPLASGLLGVAAGVAFGVALWFGNEVAGGLADAAGATYDESVRELLAPESAGGWLVLLGAVLPTVAFVEEFIFRAAAIGAVAAGFGTSPWALAVVSSLAFGAAHGAQGRVGMVVTGSLGFALAAGFVLTESLLVVVLAHYLVNALELVVHEGLGVDRLFG